MSNREDGATLIVPVLHHVSIKTTRLQEMVDWYCKFIGMKFVFQFPGAAFLSHDEANHRLALFTSPGIQEDSNRLIHNGIHHFSFEYPTVDALIDKYKQLKEMGIEPHLVMNQGATTSFYYIDPDGCSVELQIDNFGSWKTSTEWMKTSMASQPNVIGVTFDPDAWVAARQEGASLEDLNRRSVAEEFPPTRPMDIRLPM
jgi:catechol 2,3-dioxygenase